MRRHAAFSNRNASGSSMTTAKAMLRHMPLVCRSNPAGGGVFGYVVVLGHVGCVADRAGELG